jgi:hypothetical protein
MAIIDRVFRTIACDGPNCAKTVTFEKNKADNIVEQHPWLKTARLVQARGRNFVYCSDSCEVAAISVAHLIRVSSSTEACHRPSSGPYT